MSLPILTVPDEALRAKSVPIKTITPEVQELLLDLTDSLRSATDPEGVGLSAPQVGQNIRLFVTFLDKKLRYYINPILISTSEELTLGGTSEKPVLEGCLSIPELYGPIYRPTKIKIEATNEKGETFTRTLSSFPARVFLHELDHLDGVLFTDYTIKKNLPLYILENDKFTKIDNPESVIKW